MHIYTCTYCKKTGFGSAKELLDHISEIHNSPGQSKVEEVVAINQMAKNIAQYYQTPKKPSCEQIS